MWSTKTLLGARLLLGVHRVGGGWAESLPEPHGWAELSRGALT